MLSLYAKPDTTVIGTESLALSAIRKLFHRHKSLSHEMGYGDSIPHFFHYTDQDAYLEVVNDELVITKWQCVPLVRYNLHDKVKLYSWKELRQLVLSRKDGTPSNQPSL